MKKKSFSLMAFFLLALMGAARADVIEIGTGQNTTYQTPFNSLYEYSFVEQIYTAYTAAYEKCEMVYPADSLESIAGRKITNMKFYTSKDYGDNDGSVALYPNPTHGKVTIEGQDLRRIAVVNALGQVAFDKELKTNAFTLDLSQYGAGVYMVRIYTGQGLSVERIVVTK